MVFIHYYDLKIRSTLGAASNDSVIEVASDGARVRKINKNELSKSWMSARKAERDENRREYKGKYIERDQTKTRKTEKWVQDMMLHYEMIQKNKYFSLLDLSKIIRNKNLIFKGQSPGFYTDYQWYKKFEIKKYNQNIIESYKRERINFLDFEQKFNSGDYEKKEKILNKVITVNKLINNMSVKKLEKNYVFKILNQLNKISLSLNALEKNNKISLAIFDFVKSLKIYFKSGKLNTNKIKVFKTFWGHGTSQISMLKY